MKIEHVGYMVQDPIRVAEWYCQNLGFRVARGMQVPPFTHFLVDAEGQGMLEIYNNSAARVPDYASMDPLVFHVAFNIGAEAIESVRDRLLAAGAAIYSDLALTPAGDQLIMLRDPWGMALQLAKRKIPMLA
jgi:catechol 2,3-dioxygenase-like lactoylglutathione lyase family enzyme